MWEKLKVAVWQRYGTACWVCGHGGASDGRRGTLDHVTSYSEDPARAWDLDNLRPVHDRHRPCVTCRAAAAVRGETAGCCNEVKNVGTVERARVILRRRTGLPMPGDEPAEQGLDAWDW